MEEAVVSPLIDEWLVRLTEFVVPVINLIALLVIVWGVVHALIGVIRAIATRDRDVFRGVWMSFSRWLVAGLTFQLAAIAAIRTFLNYFLERDINEMEAKRREARQGTETTGGF